jgi:hypothetical protein
MFNMTYIKIVNPRHAKQTRKQLFNKLFNNMR